MNIYEERECSTCNITRPPLAHHCRICNTCVINFDHHCTVLNSCIGVRNHRAFLITLTFAWISYWCICTLGIVFIFWKDMIQRCINNSDGLSKSDQLEIALDSGIFALITIKFVLNYCSNASYGN